jgi:transaldolase
MAKNPLMGAGDVGQSIWYDNITRKMVRSGQLKKMMDEDGLKGVTSNPSIFEKAIGSSADYDSAIAALLSKDPNLTETEIFERLAVEDIREACDVLRPVFEKTQGLDGYVSIEVNPKLARKTAETLVEARHLWKSVGRPNVMIKVPATNEGLPAIRTLISEGTNVNITLMFSKQDYEDVVEAYISGLEDRLRKNGKLSDIRSVASFFVSRIDNHFDKALEAKGNKDLLGKIGIANAKAVYKRSLEIFSSARWEKLKKAGAHDQRLLWASTSTKNPAYPELMYLEALMGPNTVDTVPPATYESYRAKGQPKNRLSEGLNEAVEQIQQLAKVGVDYDKITKAIKDEGVALFEKSFDGLVSVIAEKRKKIKAA